MESQPLDPEAAAKKAKAKAAHRYSMLGIGWVWILCAAIACYLAFSKGDLPPFLYGRLTKPAGPAVPSGPVPPVLVHWHPWDSDLFKFALQENKLVFLSVTALGPREARVMDETAYNQPVVAAYLEKNFIPVEIDADERPDLALRFGAAPATALLLPGGEPIHAGGAMNAVVLLRWAQGIEERYHADPARAADEFRRARGDWNFAPPSGRAADPALVDPQGGYLLAKDDSRLFAAPNGRTAAVILRDKATDANARAFALKTLERWWKLGVRAGEVRHGMTVGVQGLLADQAELGQGFAAAYEATGDRKWLERSVALARFAETHLMDEKSKGLFDRPAWRELPAGFDQILAKEPFMLTVRFYERLVQDLPVGDPFRERLKARGFARSVGDRF